MQVGVEQRIWVTGSFLRGISDRIDPQDYKYNDSTAFISPDGKCEIEKGKFGFGKRVMTIVEVSSECWVVPREDHVTVAMGVPARDLYNGKVPILLDTFDELPHGKIIRVSCESKEMIDTTVDRYYRIFERKGLFPMPMYTYGSDQCHEYCLKFEERNRTQALIAPLQIFLLLEVGGYHLPRELIDEIMSWIDAVSNGGDRDARPAIITRHS